MKDLQSFIYGGLLALKYYELYLSRRDWFVPQCIALFKNGFNQPPAEMLSKFLGINLTGQALLNNDDLDSLESSAEPNGGVQLKIA